MATAAAVRSAPPEIERIFQSALFLLLVTGFATLASTGKLDLISVLFVLSALLLRGYVLLRNLHLAIPARLTAWLSLVYVLLFFADFFFLSGRDFVTPAVHLVLFGMCVKLFNVERERDYIYLAVLAFLMVLSAAILTVDSAFLASFALFMGLAVFCFMAMEMRRSSLTARNVGPLAFPGLRTRRRWISPIQRMSNSLAGTALVMVVAILATATLLFFAMPRISGGYLSRHAQSDLISTGFSDSVNLGEIGRIQQSSEIVAHIHIEGDSAGEHQIRLRGAALTSFDGKRWSARHQEGEALAQAYGRLFQLARPLEGEHREELRMARGPVSQRLQYRVLMEPLNTPVIFTMPVAQALFGRFREIAIDEEQTFRNEDHERVVTVYEGVSDVSAPVPAQLEKLPQAMPPLPARYLQLPAQLDPRIPGLARSITSGQRSVYARAEAIERYLTTQFAYTLELPSEPQADPLADFLFHRRRGHCEYFASSMALLLRTQGIPSRVITGFRGGQFNQLNATYIIRASDAHSWVEAYIPGAGWLTFDPTPPAGAPITSMWTRYQLYLDAAREFWREWVVNYDAAHQQTLSVSSLREGRSTALSMQQRARLLYLRMLNVARKVHRTATTEPQRLLRPLAGVMLLAVLIALPIALFHLRRALHAASPTRAPATASARFYQRLLRLLARHGYNHAPSQTAEELAASIAEPPLREAVLRFSASYQRARFGASAPDAAELPALLQLVRQQLAR